MIKLKSDIYFDFNYASSFAKLEKAEFEEVVFECAFGSVYYGFIKRKIETTMFDEVFDISTPYGYGGPLILFCNDKEKLEEEFTQHMQKHFKKNNVIAEFIRFHPLYDNQKSFNHYIKSEFVRNTVAIDLTVEDVLTDEITGKARNQIRKAIKEGVKIEYDYQCESLESFISLYYKTMKKNNATDYYYFSHEFFEDNIKNLKENIIIINAIYNDQIISSAMFLCGESYMHYYFSATESDYYKLCPVNLILYYAALLGKEKKLDKLHLGGGTSNNKDDSLLKFKKGFSKNDLYDFYIGKNIWNCEVYKLLCREKNKEIDSGFFPAYRG